MSAEAAEVFLEELQERLESLERALLDLREAPDDRDLVNQAFRDLHTIKGSGAMFGFAELAAFVHDFETAFERLRDGSQPVTAGLIRLALQARDEIPGLAAGKADPEGRRQALLAALHDDTPGGEAAAPTAETETPATSVGPAGLRRLTFGLQGDALAIGARPETLLDALRALGARDIVPDLSALPALADLNPGQCHLRWSMLLPPDVDPAAVEEVFEFVDADVTLAVVADAAPVPAPDSTPEPGPDAAQPAAPRSATPAVASAGSRAAAATVRVPAERLDTLMDAVGELVIAEARLAQIVRHARDPALVSAAEQITRIASGLRDTAMMLRMVPVGTMIPRFRRLVSDLSDRLGKPVDFVVTGEETELDKTLIERLADPLVHLLRNALDHGFEPVADRLAAGKPARGRLELLAEQRGPEVVLQLRDDGRGIDPDKLRARAVARGLIAPEAVLTRAQLLALLFEPGFSTAERVTELSGRGVGMDVVRRTVEGLRGTIRFDAEVGQGSVVTLSLPLTLAIIETLLVEAGGERYLLPLSAVQEIVAWDAKAAGAGKAPDHLDVRGQFVPVLAMADLLGCAAATGQGSVVIVRQGGDCAGLVVDRVLGNRQTVIKQMSRLHANLRSIAGATITGDGTVALVLDVAGLLALGRNRQARARQEVPA